MLLAWLALASASRGVPMSPHAANFELLGPSGQPVLGADDLAGYHWATHVLALRPGALQRLRAALEGDLIAGVPFTVRASGADCYRGAFTTSLSSGTQS